MPLIDPDYLRRASLARSNVGFLPNTPDDYNTRLTPEEEEEFRRWQELYKAQDLGTDYDLRGAWKAGEGVDAEGHMQDDFKKPNHETFSDQSQYAIGDDAAKAGRWDENDQFMPPGGYDDNSVARSLATEYGPGAEMDPLLGQDPTLDPRFLEETARADVGAPPEPGMGRALRGEPEALPDFSLENEWTPPGQALPEKPLTEQEALTRAMRHDLGLPGEEAGTAMEAAGKTLKGYPEGVRPYLAAAIAPAVTIARGVDELPDAVASALTAPKRAMTGELPIWAEDPETGEIHSSPQGIQEGMNIAMTAPLGGLFATPLTNATGMGVRTRMAPKPKPAPKLLPKRDAAFFDAPNKEAKFPQYAYEYPETIPGRLLQKTGKYVEGRAPPGKPFPKGEEPSAAEAAAMIEAGTAYREKALSPEAKAFQRERDKVKRQMETEGFTPFFDPSKRFDVDPKAYPRAQETVNIRMKSDAAHKAWLKKVNTRANIERLKKDYFRGLKFPDTTDWYFVGQMEAWVKKRLGAKAGREAFKDFTGRMAATTGGMMPEPNLLLAHFTKWADNRKLNLGRDFTTSSLPYPVGGGKYGAKNNLREAGKFQEGKIFGEENPKRDDFQDAFLGHDPFVVDEQEMSSFRYPGRQSAPPHGTYGYHTKTGIQAADELGVPRKEFQGVGWHGIKRIAGEPFIQTINKAIERTHRLTGLARSEILEGMFKDIKAGRVPALYANPKELAPLLAIMSGKKPKLASDILAPVLEPKIAPPFYSSLEKFVEGADQKRALGSQWLGMMKNAHGVRAEELEFTGVDKFLTGEPRMVTKGELQNFIRENKLKVTEDLLGKPPEPKKTRTKKDTSPVRPHEIEDLKKELRDHGWTGIENDLSEIFGETYVGGRLDRAGLNTRNPEASRLMDRMQAREGTLSEAEREAAFAEAAVALRNRPPKVDVTEVRGIRRPERETQYDKWTEKGGKNYRELRFSMPEHPSIQRHDVIGDHGAIVKSFDNLEEAEAFAAEKREQGYRGTTVKTRNTENPKNFSTGHFRGKKNLLGWAMFKDRVDIGKKKTLAVEEIQSDLHQKGREHGYKGQYDKKISELETKLKATKNPGEAMAFSSQLNDLLEKKRALDQNPEAVPDFPLKKNWHEMVMKRMIRWAAEHGYDQLAWMPGKTVAAKYKLSKAVNSIGWSPQMSGHGKVVNIRMKGGGDIALQVEDGKVVSTHGAGRENFMGRKLDEIIGKDITRQVLGEEKGNLTGVDLDIGGEGMKYFYDKMLAADAEKISGEKVGVTHVQKGTKPQGRPRGARIVGSSEGGFRIEDRDGNNLGNTTYTSRIGARDALAEMYGKPAMQEMWFIPITKKLRARAMEEGFSLPANPKEAAPLGMGRAQLPDDEEE